MKPVIFLARVTFIYNICTLLTWLMRYLNFFPEGNLKSTIIVSGLLLAVVFNILTGLWCVFLVLKGEPLSNFRPQWLFISNLLCFIYQIYLLIR